MRRDKDCPYKKHCHDAPEGCENCDWHLAFEKFRQRIIRLENRLSKTKAMLEMYRGVEGCRLHEMMDAELQGRCFTVPEYSRDAIATFRAYFRKFAFDLCTEASEKEVLDICVFVNKMLEKIEVAAVTQDAKREKEGEKIEQKAENGA